MITEEEEITLHGILVQFSFEMFKLMNDLSLSATSGWHVKREMNRYI